MRRLRLGLSLLLTAVPALLGLLLVLPSPVEAGAILAVLLDEKAPWLAGLALAGMLLAPRGPVRPVNPRARLSAPEGGRPVLPLGLGVVAVALALWPLVSALSVARKEGVRPSAGRYLRDRVDRGAPPQPVRTLDYATVGGVKLALDLLEPPVEDRGNDPVGRPPRPAVIVIHGGSWSGGDKGELPLSNAWLSRRGFVVLDIQYRLSPQPNWKTATGDVKCAIGWVKAHAAELAIDPSRIVLLGRSAGAQLALLAAYTAGDPLLGPTCPAPDTGVSAVVSFYAPVDLAWGYAHPANLRVFDGPAALRRFLGGTPEEVPEAYRLASPVFRATRASPPTLLLHGGRDQFVLAQNLELLDARLSALGVRHAALRLPYAQHGFDYIYGGLGEQLAEAALLRFLAPPRRR